MLAPVARSRNVPSIYLSELDGPRWHAGRDRRPSAKSGVAVVSWASIRSSCSIHWLVNANYHINCAPHPKGLYTSNELPHFISNLPFEFPGNPALGKILAKTCNEMGWRRWRTMRRR